MVPIYVSSQHRSIHLVYANYGIMFAGESRVRKHGVGNKKITIEKTINSILPKESMWAKGVKPGRMFELALESEELSVLIPTAHISVFQDWWAGT